MTEDVPPEDVILYVRSEETIRRLVGPEGSDAAVRALRQNGHYTFATAAYAAGHSTGGGQAVWTQGESPRAVEGTELPDDEVEAIDRVRAAVVSSHKTPHIVDVGQQTRFHRYLSEHLHHLRAFPVLCRPDGRRLEGTDEFTDEKLRGFLADA